MSTAKLSVSVVQRSLCFLTKARSGQWSTCLLTFTTMFFAKSANELQRVSFIPEQVLSEMTWEPGRLVGVERRCLILFWIGKLWRVCSCCCGCC